MLQTAALILAAGKGTRMHSDKPKVLQTVLGEPMLRYVLEAVRPVFDGRVLVVVGHQAGMVEAAFPDASFVHQEQQLGTGHALMQAMPALEGQCERVLVVNGDTPLLSEDVVRHFVEASEGADLAFATIELDDPAAYGRVVRAADGSVRAIVEFLKILKADFCNRFISKIAARFKHLFRKLHNVDLRDLCQRPCSCFVHRRTGRRLE